MKLALFLVHITVSCYAIESSAREVKLFVPFGFSPEMRVELGGKTCQVLSVNPVHDVPVILIANFSLSGEMVKEHLAELKGSIAAKDAIRIDEIWLNGGVKEHTLAIRFADGWVGVLSPNSRPGARFPDSVTRSEDIELLAKRFAKSGPAIAILLNDHFDYDGRYDGGIFTNGFSNAFPWMGAAGLSLFPVVIPKPGKRMPSPQILESFTAKRLGTKLLESGGSYGDAVRHISREVQKGSLLTLRLPKVKYTLRGFEPKLVIYSRNSKKPFFERRFAATNEEVDSEIAKREFSQHLTKVVEPFVPDTADFVVQCGSQSSTSPSEYFLKLSGRALNPLGRLTTSVEIVVDNYSKAGRAGFVTSLGMHPLSAIDGVGCIGPIERPTNSTVFLYAKKEGWMSVIRVE